MLFLNVQGTNAVMFYDYCSEVHDQALYSCDIIHRERRIFLKQEIGRMVLFFTDQPSLLAPNIQVLFNFALCSIKGYDLLEPLMFGVA